MFSSSRSRSTRREFVAVPSPVFPMSDLKPKWPIPTPIPMLMERRPTGLMWRREGSNFNVSWSMLNVQFAAQSSRSSDSPQRVHLWTCTEDIQRCRVGYTQTSRGGISTTITPFYLPFLLFCLNKTFFSNSWGGNVATIPFSPVDPSTLVINSNFLPRPLHISTKIPLMSAVTSSLIPVRNRWIAVSSREISRYRRLFQQSSHNWCCISYSLFLYRIWRIHQKFCLSLSQHLSSAAF